MIVLLKWSDGKVEDFPKLSVKVRDEVVTFGVPGEIKVGLKGIVGGGKHLKPEAVHRLVAERGDEVVFLDGRNAYEAAIGKFKNAIVPGARTTKDFITELEKPAMQKLKNRPIVTYCTGGVRCEAEIRLEKCALTPLINRIMRQFFPLYSACTEKTYCVVRNFSPM